MDEKEDDFYMVKGEDETLDSIAARFLLSPNELVTLNRLGSRFVFKGQKLRIRFPTPKKSNHPSVDCTEEEDLFDSQFVRLGVSHVTDGRGIVRGSLLFTPKSFMFNPLPQDPLVLEAKDNNNESLLDSYQLIAPMDLVVCISLFKEFIKLNSVKDRDIIEKDDLLNTSEASMGTDETRYLRLAIGIPREEELAKNTPVISYGEQKLYPEYWFIVRGHKTEKLLKFFTDWFSDLYGIFSPDKIVSKSMCPVPEGGIYLDSSSTKKRGALSKTITQTTFDLGLTIPRLIGKSYIFNDALIKFVAEILPPRTFGHDLNLNYSTEEHGFSLKNLYRRMPSSDEEPVLLIIKDSNDNIFGAYLSCALRISEHFTGTGESFLFRTNPDIEVFRWTGENDYILKGETNSFGIGMSDGHFGLWLDEDLNLGRTERCSTFNNNPLTSHDFHVNNLECWTFTL
ncbi:nuclear receptor coactivator 7 [Lepeophtheirus salmonis]|uniref:nuclear receptor coactivator 7 n=1 Tax=Lepeophtheirus salmonis TaxID=72036 RepID=UPI001AE2B218|nr:oxidation resistance protein 1-like [Lepeophtheirus salmonis]